MDENKYKNKTKIMTFAFLIGGIADLALAVMAYFTNQYTMMGFMAINGLIYFALSYVSDAIFYKLSLLKEKEEHNEEEI